MKNTLRMLALTSALPLLSLLSASAHALPEGKTECIAPAQPGGGWDFTCRSVARTLQELDLIPAMSDSLGLVK